MLARLYALADAAPWEMRTAAAGLVVRRMQPSDRMALRSFIMKQFSEEWAVEADLAYAGGHPITGFVATQHGKIAGFAAYECTRRGFFGPTGVREDVRGCGAGAALLLRCLESMREMGYGYAIIGGVGPAEFYERICGATLIEDSTPGVYADMYREGAERAAIKASD